MAYCFWNDESSLPPHTINHGATAKDKMQSKGENLFNQILCEYDEGVHHETHILIKNLKDTYHSEGHILYSVTPSSYKS